MEQMVNATTDLLIEIRSESSTEHEKRMPNYSIETPSCVPVPAISTDAQEPVEASNVEAMFVEVTAMSRIAVKSEW
jgi:hypothetical protein